MGGHAGQVPAVGLELGLGLLRPSKARGSCARRAPIHIPQRRGGKERAMQCPVDGSELVMTERSGVEIDYCPKCRGVWLDRGELDKIIDRSAAQTSAPTATPPPAPGPRYEDDRHHGKPYRKKRESFLGDLFDF
jgi:uncharacterized protein